MFYITDGVRFLKKDSKLTCNLSEAGKWREDKVNNVLNSIKRNKYKQNFDWYIVDEFSFNAYKPEVIENFSFDEFLKTNPSEEKLFSIVIKLNDDFQRIEKELLDYRHIIELEEISDKEIITTYKSYKTKLQERRIIKDNLYLILNYHGCKSFDVLRERLESRKYRFRSSLFVS